MSPQVTIKELSTKLKISVPTLRKYGECGLLAADSSIGRTHLFDEAAAVARIAQINFFKGRGYSLSLIRQKLEQLGAVPPPLDAGIQSAAVTLGRHAMLVVEDIAQYIDFARPFILNGLRAGQAVILLVHPDHREPLEKIVSGDGFDLDHLARQHQLTFAWHYEAVESGSAGEEDPLDEAVREVVDAGWQTIRVLGHPQPDSRSIDEPQAAAYHRRLSAYAKRWPVIVVCPWLARSKSAQMMVAMLRDHDDLSVGASAYVKARPADATKKLGWNGL
ncbi:MAG: MEDS domain-containing protein [Candidatus Eremiobacteraeota bacterium]|nr:MEDS domain-containing protein [Candidatus Eremiobacteraeota bacterium]